MAGLTNTTQREWEAIVSCAMKAQNKYEDQTTKDQVEIVRAWAKKWLINKEKSNEGARKWNKEHPERHRKTNLEYYHRNKDKVKKYYEANKDKFREYHRKYYEENKDKIREYHRKYRQERRKK